MEWPACAWINPAKGRNGLWCLGTKEQVHDSQTHTENNRTPTSNRTMVPSGLRQTAPSPEAIADRAPIVECQGKDGTCGKPEATGHSQCPACSNWPCHEDVYERNSPRAGASCRCTVNDRARARESEAGSTDGVGSDAAWRATGWSPRRGSTSGSASPHIEDLERGQHASRHGRFETVAALTVEARK